MRLTDAAWEKLGRIAEEQEVTRADLLERAVVRSQGQQLDLFEQSAAPSLSTSQHKEVVTKETLKNGTALANRLGVSSAALTNWIKSKQMPQKTASHDPDGISWERIPKSTKYRPML